MLGRDTGLIRTLLMCLALVLGCSSCSGDPVAAPAKKTASSATTSATTTAPPEPAPPPKKGACYRLKFTAAISPTNSSPPVSCLKQNTSRTYFVGRLGRLFPQGAPAVDAPQVNVRVGADCRRRLQTFLGGPEQALRLSMFRPVWFTPTFADGHAGASWYRCDVVALATDGALLPLTGKLAGILDTTRWQATYGLCATAEPGQPAFRRVACDRKHAWEAISTVPFRVGRYPGPAQVRTAGEGPCQSAAKARAADPLNYRWGYEWPTLDQWRAGFTYGVCWVPA